MPGRHAFAWLANSARLRGRQSPSNAAGRSFELSEIKTRGVAASRLAAASVRRDPEVTIHQLRIFWAVANSETLTKAAKQLGLAQPSLSQQLSRLEQITKVRLFDRRSNQMILTEAGEDLLRRAEHVLKSMEELQDRITDFGDRTRVTLRIAGISSVLRVVLPDAMLAVQRRFPLVEFDLNEAAPGDVLELLYGRRANIGLVAANTLAESSVGFLQVPVLTDPYVFAVPASIDLSAARRLTDLPLEAQETLNRSIQFVFGTQHSKQVEDWYDRHLPDHHVIAQCRTFESAIGMVRSGLGVCLAPALSAIAGREPIDGVALYRVETPARRIVALVSSQYRRLEPYATLLDSLEQTGPTFPLPATRTTAIFG